MALRPESRAHPLAAVLAEVDPADCPRRLNFHCHTLCSDGSLAPELLAEEAEAFDVEERERTMQALRSCLEAFSPPHQELLLAPYSGEGRVTMLAEQAGKSANALYKLLGRLREKLTECIETRLQKEAL